MFGHFELPSFYMNAMVQMPDHGELRAEDFKNQSYVFSGHFHKRQHKENYIILVMHFRTTMQMRGMTIEE